MPADRKSRKPNSNTKRAASPVVTEIAADLDLAGAVALHKSLLDSVSAGRRIEIELSDGRATHPSIQLLFAARASAASGAQVSFGARAQNWLDQVWKEDRE